MSSWTQQQGPPVVQQQTTYPITTSMQPPTSTATSGGSVAIQNTSTGYFSQQKWQQQQPAPPQFYNPQQQPQQQHQLLNTMQQQPQTVPSQNNWFTPSLNAAPQSQQHQQLPQQQPSLLQQQQQPVLQQQQQQPPLFQQQQQPSLLQQHQQPLLQQQQPLSNNWQQQPLQPAAAPSTNSSTGYFVGAQQSTTQNNNFYQQQQNTTPQYQSLPSYATHNNVPNLQATQAPQFTNMPQPQPQKHLIDTNNISQSFIKTEEINNSHNSQQHQELIDNQKNQNPPTKLINNNDGWDNEWEWNDNNNQQLQQQQQPQQQPLNSSNNMKPNFIEESFKVEPNDNWQWGMENQKNSLPKAQPPPTESINIETKEITNNFEINSLTNHQSVGNIQTGFSTNIPATVNINQMDTKSFTVMPPEIPPYNTSSENNQTPNSSVYVSQAKPVAQPSRQFASLPDKKSEAESNSRPISPPQVIQQSSFTPQHPNASQSPSLSNLPPPPAVETPPLPINSLAALPPPPLLPQDKANNNNNNPFKRSGLAQHHRATGYIPPPKNTIQPTVVMSNIQQQQNNFFTPPPDEFQNQQTSTSPGNQEFLAPENSEVIIDRTASETLSYDNLEVVAPSNDRNQYLQTSHLSEEGLFPATSHNLNTRLSGIGGPRNELDNLPPPGLSRYVLGQPELISSANDIPPGLDRMVPGTELVSSSSLNLEREADGQDTIPSPRSVFTNMMPPVQENNVLLLSGNLDVTTDRNLYLVPGESEHHEQQQPVHSQQQSTQSQQQQQRVVTGLENEIPTNQQQQSSGEQREVELDGENLEDEPSQTIQVNYTKTELDMSTTRDEPIEGANTLDSLTTLSSNQQLLQQSNNNNNNNETESSLTIDTHPKDLSNPSTGNDESDHHRNHYVKATRRNVTSEEKLKKRIGNKESNDKRKERYVDSEESDLSLDREHRRYREGSIRNDRGVVDNNRESKEKERREKREGSNKHRGSNEREERTAGNRYERDEKDRNTGNSSKRNDRERRDRDRGTDRYDKNDRGSRYATNSRYETDSKYETEGSRYEKSRKDDRDRDRDRYDDYKRDEKENRKHRHRDGGGIDRHADERRSERRRTGRDRANDRSDYRDDRNSDRMRNRNDRIGGGKSRPEYEEEYRKGNNGSRNTRSSDHEKDRTGRAIAIDKDSRYAQMYGGYPPGYNYDPYAYYQQQQQYYEKLRRTNPQAYAEWYRKYYAGQVQPDINATGLSTTDGRESVHSGRSSANNDKDRSYNLLLHHQHQLQQQQQYIPQTHHNSDYHQHFLQLSNVSSTPNVSLIAEPPQQQHQLEQTFHNLNFNGKSISNSNLLLLSQYPPSTVQNNNGNGQNSTTFYPGYGGYRSYYTQSEYSESRPENASINLISDGISSSSAAAAITQDPQRATPLKYTNDHSTATISIGLLVCVKPKYSLNGTTNIVKLLRISPNDATRRLFQSFPGPLIRGLTHKKTIIEFCEEQIRLGPSASITVRSRQNSMSSLSSANNIHKESFTLMWNLLILLLRQNGMVVGTDIAELLMKNKIQFPYDVVVNIQSGAGGGGQSKSISPQERGPTATANENPIIDDKEILIASPTSTADRENKNDLDSNDEELNLPEDKMPTTLTEQQITDKFRNYLLYGNVNEALEWATDNNLWGHALFLASKVDRRSHANVMMKFANKLSLNDPLQTLYQLMSGRTPSSVTSVQDEKWGDWRPHLAMILSNTSQRPDLDRKAITTLGDSLYNRGDLYGAQFCYLMAQVGFGRYSDVNLNEKNNFMPNAQNAVRIILLGASHHNQFREFAINEAIMMTEIYEYACSLNDDKFSIVEFQPYKYLLANRMLDYGYQLKALLYMEQISINIQRDPTKFDASFIEKIYTLADRLKYFDPVLEKTMDDQHNDFNNLSSSGGNMQIEDQKWLKDLRDILSEYQINNPMSQVIGGQQNLTNYETSVDQNRATIDQQFVEINQEFSKLSMQYNNIEPIEQTVKQQSYDTPLTVNNDQYHPQFYNPNDMNNVGHNNDIGSSNNNTGYNYMQQQQQQYNSSSNVAEQSIQNQDINNAGGYGNNYEYWGDQQQQQQQQQQHDQNSNEIQATARPTITLPNSVQSNKQPASSSYYDNDIQQNNNSTNVGATSGGAGRSQQKTDPKNTNKSGGNGNLSTTTQNSGWFGGIWNKLSLKPKNQMILPDDKNPAIVWDADKKKWVNTDGDIDNEQENFKPPPKMNDIMPIVAAASPALAPQQTFNPTNYGPIIQQNTMPQQQQLDPQIYGQPLQSQTPNFNMGQQSQQSQQPSVSGYNENYNNSQPQIAVVPTVVTAAAPTTVVNEPTIKTPNLQSNMFKMQRNRTLKKSYVDVFNPSGATSSKPIEPVLAPTIPNAVPQTGFFIPTPTISGDNNTQSERQQQQIDNNAPQFYNPNQYGGYQQ